MSFMENIDSKLTEEKITKFEEMMKIPEEMSELILNIFEHEYTKTFPDLLHISKNMFLSVIQKNILTMLENIYSFKIKENKEFQNILENIYKKIEEKYDSDYNIIKNEWIDTPFPKEEKENKYLTKYLKHCFNDNEFANHNCQINSKFIIISNDKTNSNNIDFVICNKCNKIYKASFILCKCYKCDIEYYSEIINTEEDIYLFHATWKKYHCPQLIKDKISCSKCNTKIFLNMKTGMLNCPNEKCGNISDPKNILWLCNSCNKNFESDVIIYNPLNEKLIQDAIKRALLIKQRAHPNHIPCCKINVSITNFYHENECKGILYLGEIFNELIIICEKCHDSNYYKNYTWTCPECHITFKDNENKIENKDKKEIIENNNSNTDNKCKNNDKIEDKIIKKENNMEEHKIENQNNNYETISISKIDKKSLMKKYQSFRYNRNTDDKKKYALNLPNIGIKQNNISKINLYEKNTNCSNEPNPNKPKKKYLYRSQKFYLNRFKIEKNFAKEKVEKVKEENLKENKNILNKINNPEKEIQNNLNQDLKIEVEKNKVEPIKVRKGRKSVYQYYKNLREKNKVTSDNKEEEQKITEENKIKVNIDNNNKEKGIKRFSKLYSHNNFNRLNLRRKTLNNLDIKININEFIKEKEGIQTERQQKKETEQKEFVTKLNLEGNVVTEKEEEKEYTKGTIIDNKNLNSTEDSNSSNSKSLKVSKIPGMSDDLYSQIMQQINTIFSTCKIPRFNMDEFTITRKLGEGSYGIIHCLIKDNTQEKYALKKIIAPSISKVNEFVREFELVNLCQHPNILKIYGLNINLLDHSTYSIQVLMEKAERDWNKDIKRRKQEEKYYTEKELLSIMKQLTLALLYMKEQLNLAHRDIKPQNVLIFENNIFKLADFGEAKEIENMKNFNTLRGTELYMSPALYNGLKINKDDIEHDPFKSDLFSLGFCFIFAATMDFNLLYSFRNINDEKEMKRKLNEILKDKYSDKFIYILSKMIELDEKNRFDFNELNNEIDRVNINEGN